jgi:hypothetical protein
VHLEFSNKLQRLINCSFANVSYGSDVNLKTLVTGEVQSFVANLTLFPGYGQAMAKIQI